MITEKDLQEAIAECEGQRNPGASTCLKLAAFYTIRNEMFPKKTESLREVSEVYMDSGRNVIAYNGQSDFSKLINGKRADDVWPIMDELMDALMALNPRLYNSVMHKLQG